MLLVRVEGSAGDAYAHHIGMRADADQGSYRCGWRAGLCGKKASRCREALRGPVYRPVRERRALSRTRVGLA
ncbi:hypothetical protein COL27_27630, partial [Bacillus sp. AFS075960]